MSVHLMSRDELTIVTVLRSTEFLHGLSSSHLKKLASIAGEVEFSRDEIIHRAGDLGQAIYLLQTGRVNIEVDTPEGGRVTVLSLGPGQVFGLSSLFPPQRKKGTARVMEPTRAIRLDAGRLRHLFESDHQLERVFMARTAELINDRVKATWLELARVFAVNQPAEE